MKATLFTCLLSFSSVVSCNGKRRIIWGCGQTGSHYRGGAWAQRHSGESAAQLFHRLKSVWFILVTVTHPFTRTSLFCSIFHFRTSSVLTLTHPTVSTETFWCQNWNKGRDQDDLCVFVLNFHPANKDTVVDQRSREKTWAVCQVTYESFNCQTFMLHIIIMGLSCM